MDPGPTKARARRCHHCGNEVSETVHTQLDYRVGFYELHTGEVEVVTRLIHGNESEVTFLKLVRPEYIVTCPSCYARPEILAERDRLFRPEDN